MFDKYQFTKEWTNPSDFPTVETDESKVRSDAQLLHTETKNAIHKLGLKMEKVLEFTIDGASHSVIVLRKVAHTPPQYPRRYAQIKKSPL